MNIKKLKRYLIIKFLLLLGGLQNYFRVDVLFHKKQSIGLIPKSKNIGDLEKEKVPSLTLVSTKEKIVDIATADFENAEDEFFNNGFTTTFSPKNYVKNHSLSAPVVKSISSFYQKRMDEIALVKSDPQVKEAYSCYSVADIKKITNFYKVILDDLSLSLGNIQRARKPRVPKQKSAVDLTKNIELAKLDPITKIETISKQSIIGKSVLIFYNTKNRLLNR